MSSLKELLIDEAFENGGLSGRRVKLSHPTAASRNEAFLPIYICHDIRRTPSRRKPKPVGLRPRSNSCSERLESVPDASSSSRSRSSLSRRHHHTPHEAAIDEVAVKAVVSILAGYIGRYLTDTGFRRILRDKCTSCLTRNRKHEPDPQGIFTDLESGIESIDNLLLAGSRSGNAKDLSVNSIRMLNIVAYLNSKDSVNSSTCGIPNQHLSACAQLYLSVVYKMEKNNRISARHLLQVFVDSPFLARAHLLPDLWEHLFLPHLLHVKVWYTKEVELLSGPSSAEPERDKRMKELGKVYSNHMDVGTARFALYYKQWLKVGAEPPPLPHLPLPSGPLYRSSRRRSSDSYSSINRNLYQAVFGAKHDRDRSTDQQLLRRQDSDRKCQLEGDWNGSSRRSRSGQHKNPSPNYLPVFPCQSLPVECSLGENIHSINNRVQDVANHGGLSGDLGRAISTICSSNDLTDCELSVQVIAKSRLSSNGNPVIEASVSTAPVIEGMLEVLFASEDDAVLELAISLLAETMAKDETAAHIILNSDPQLEVFLRLLKRTSVFLKAAVLLYLLKPRSKQMISTEWVPLVLRVLEFGDQAQTLFTVQCAPRTAALYLLSQLLLGFDEDKCLENARELVSLGGLGLLIRRIDEGDFRDRSGAVAITLCCIQAERSCRNYVVENLNKSSLVELVLFEFGTDTRNALNLLTELLFLNRGRQRVSLLDEIKTGAGGLNMMHILLVHLMKSSPEERPIVAAIMLQIDLLGDLAKCSIFREEAMEAMAEALECRLCNEKVQEKAATALMMLAGRFTSNGVTSAELWLLQQSGLHEYSRDAFGSNHSAFDNKSYLDEGEDEDSQSWLSKTAVMLLQNSGTRFLTALSSSIRNSLPVLARASLVTLSWLSCYLDSVGDMDLKSTACSMFVPQMLETVNYDRSLEERVMASFSLLNLVKGSGLVDLLSSLSEESMSHLRNLSLVTWTADEVISIITTSQNTSSDYI